LPLWGERDQEGHESGQNKPLDHDKTHQPYKPTRSSKKAAREAFMGENGVEKKPWESDVLSRDKQHGLNPAPWESHPFT